MFFYILLPTTARWPRLLWTYFMDGVSNIRASTAGTDNTSQPTQIDQASNSLAVDLRPTNSSPKRKAEPEPYNGGSQDSVKSAKNEDNDDDGPPYTQPDPYHKQKLSDAEVQVLKEVDRLRNEERLDALMKHACNSLNRVEVIRRLMVRELAKPDMGKDGLALYIGAVDALAPAKNLAKVVNLLQSEIDML